MFKIYESMTSDTYFISSLKSGTGWFTYTKEYGLEEWCPFFNPANSKIDKPLTNTGLKIYREIRKAHQEYK